jgi:putative hydrolase of the HAD superfamily
MPQNDFKILLSDIGGVLGTNGWDTGIRDTICRHFQIEVSEIVDRHRLMFDSYERGHIEFGDYLQKVFFGVPRAFTVEQVRDFAYSQSITWPQNIALFRRVKERNRLKLGLISNEGKGITQYRVDKFGLRELADFMIISHFVHMRKPDPEIWQLALDLVQLNPGEAIYVDDRPLFVGIAQDMGFAAIHHTSLADTRDQFKSLGLEVD